MKICTKVHHGSILYGLNTPSSDEDFRAVFIPSLRTMLMNEQSRNYKESTAKNGVKCTSEDVECHFQVVHHFVKEFVTGKQNTLELAFSPELRAKSIPAFVSLVDTLKAKYLPVYTDFFVRRSYGTLSMVQKAIELGKVESFDMKEFMHGYRTILMGQEFSSNGTLTMPFTGPERDYMMGLRQRQFTSDPASYKEDIEKYRDKLSALESSFTAVNYTDQWNNREVKNLLFDFVSENIS